MKLKDKIEELRIDLVKQQKYIEWLDRIYGDVEVADTTRVDFSACLPFFYVYTREDLARLMRPGTVWQKSTYSKVMQYSCTIDGVRVSLHAQEGALPPTCKVVTKTVVIPARPEETQIVEEISCEV